MNIGETFNNHSLDVEAARAASIIGLAQRYGIDLKRKGREYFALCPFHNEKSPSFSINEDKGFFHCFGCGVNGDVIDFVQAVEGVEFKDAVDRLTGGVVDPQARDRLVRQASHPAKGGAPGVR